MNTPPSAAEVETDRTAPPRADARHRGTAIAFLASGLLLATWLSRIASVKQATGLSPAAFGLVLMAPVAGSIASMQCAPQLTSRFGSRTVLRWCLPLAGTALCLAAFAHDGTGLGVALGAFGLVEGQLYVAMTVQAVAVEKATGRSVMNFYHGLWGVGSLAGALLGGLCAVTGVGLGRHFFLVFLLVTVGALLPWAHPAAQRAFPGGDAGRPVAPPRSPGPDDSARATPRPVRPGRRRSRWNRRTTVLGALGLCCMVAQGAVEDWGTIYLHEGRGATPALAAGGFMAFTAAYVCARFLGDRLLGALRLTTLVQSCAGLAAASLVFVLLVPQVAGAVVGLTGFGAGLAILDPLLSSASGHGAPDDADAADAVAGVATVSHTGLLLGPPVVGWLAQSGGIDWVIVAPALLMLPFFCAAPLIADLRGPTRSQPASRDVSLLQLPEESERARPGGTR